MNERVSLFPRDWTARVKESTRWGPFSHGGPGQPRIGSGFAGEALSCNSVRDIIDGRMPCAGNVAGGLRDGSRTTVPLRRRGTATSVSAISSLSVDRIDYLDGS